MGLTSLHADHLAIQKLLGGLSPSLSPLLRRALKTESFLKGISEVGKSAQQCSDTVLLLTRIRCLLNSATDRHEWSQKLMRGSQKCLSQLTQTLGERIHLTSCKLLSQSAAGTATPQALALTLASAANYRALRRIPLQGSKR